MLRRAKPFSLQRKMLSNRTEVREETLGSLPIPQSAHAALPLSGRLIAVFGAIIHTRRSAYEDVLVLGKHRHSAFGCRITAKLIRHDSLRDRVVAQYPSKESLGCPGMAVLLRKDVKFAAVLVDGAP